MIHHLTNLGVLAAIRVLFPVIWAVTTRTDPTEPSEPSTTVH
ncbi:hypothetical protein [Azospirillum sp.]|nr:hypothetical protein [Azospirillum sp.]HYD66718.1 hypothetical protein [Azospirillum sp.]